jgi:hypothetical protein
MKTRTWHLVWAAGAFLGFAAVTGGATGISLQSDASKGKRSVRDGIYTEAQAKRGEDQYSYYCGACHISDLQGDSVQDVPALAGDDFMASWEGRTVGDLFDVVSKTMPKDSPGSLDAKTYGDILSYIFQANKFPAGSTELELELDRLGQIVIDGPRGK